jgi:hypothetical protein
MEQAAEMEAHKAMLKAGPGEPEEAAGPGRNGGMPPEMPMEGPTSMGSTENYQPGTYPG